ncbi:MAG: TIGR02302 family protein [Pseudomonadota bacterium]
MTQVTFRGRTRATPPSLRRQMRLSRSALLAERIAAAFWPCVSIVLFVLGLALFGVFAELTGVWHQAAVWSAVAAFVVLLGWGCYQLRLPSLDEGARRLEGDGAERPISTMTDQLAAGRDDTFANQLWIAHQRRAAAAADRLRASAPNLRMASRDRWALRLAAPVVLLAGIISAGDAWEARLATLLEAPKAAPTAPDVAPVRVAAAEGWATPPSYTGLDTVHLNRASALGPLTLPVGSDLVLRVTDVEAVPVLEGPGLTGFEGFRSYGGGLHEARAVISDSGRVSITAEGETLADWTISVTPDAPPSIRAPRLPGTTLTGAAEVHFEAEDDYGVVSAWGRIVPPGGEVESKGLPLEPLEFALPLPITGDPRRVADATIQDFSEHPWAGGPVDMTLHAEDGAGQQAVTEVITFELPGKPFTHPLARALVEQRRSLALDFGVADRVLDVLQAVTRAPDEVFDNNHGAYLAVRTAIRRLAFSLGDDRVPEIAPTVVELLWLAALSLEEGDLSSALERLRSAEQRLRDALENGTEDDIRRAIEELRMAMQEYLTEMTRQALQQQQQMGQQQQQQQPGEQGRELTQQDLDEMLDELQRRAESGLRDQARDMLSELSRMLENLQAGQMQPGQSGQGQQQMQALQEMIQRQRDLADRTFDQMRRERREGRQGGQQGQQPGQMGEGQSGEQGERGQGQQRGQGQGQGQGPGQGEGGPMGGDDLAAEQEALRRALDELARQLPGGPNGEQLRDALDDAGEAMGEARDDLSQGQNSDAVQDQMDALDRLSDGAEALAQQMQQQGQGDVNAVGDGRGRGDGRDEPRLDPFDRPAGTFGSIDGRNTGVPDRSVLDRAREVLEELRRRAAEPERPRLELDYLDRLLDQF